MEYLFKKWQKTNDKAAVDAAYQQRFHDETAIHIGLQIHPMNFPKPFELFYIPTNNMMLKIEQVHQNETRLQHYDTLLPGTAIEDFLTDVIVQELYSTNEIEGVRSSRQDIAESTKKIRLGEIPKKPRMQSMIQSYLQLTKDDIPLPTHPRDIRKTYDHITAGEIDARNLPDGELFIKEGAEVSGNAIGTVLHKGIQSESGIIAHLTALLEFLKRDDLPLLIKLAVSHYYFGYIHPFYDGNGRTGRFITSLYLSKNFSPYTAISFSNGCRLKHKRYLDLFAFTNKFNAYGEMNFAIDAFLEILLAGQTFVLNALQEKQVLLETALACIAADPRLQEDDLAQNIVFLFCQIHLFSTDNSMTRQELQRRLKSADAPFEKPSVHKITTTLAELEQHNYLRRIKQKPITYVLNEQFLENRC